MNHAALTTASLVAVLVVQLLDQLEKIVVDLRLVALSYLFLLLSVHVHLCLEHGLAVRGGVLRWPSASTALCGRHGLQGALRDLRRDHRAVRGLLLDRDDNFSVALRFRIGYLRHALPTSGGIFWGMRRSIKVGILLRLVLHLELREERLFELSLLGGAYRLTGNLLHVVDFSAFLMDFLRIIMFSMQNRILIAIP